MSVPDAVYQFVVESDYTDESIERWSKRFPEHAETFRDAAMSARLERLREQPPDSFDAYLPPDPDEESVCWE